EREARTQSHVLIGTLRYLPPERYRSTGDPQPAGDVFALGCMLYEGLWGAPLIPGHDLVDSVALTTQRDRFEAHVREALAAPPPGLPSGIAELVASMVGYAADERPTPAQVCDAVERFAREVPGPGLVAWCRARRWSEVALAAPNLYEPAGEGPSGLAPEPASG